MATEPRRGLITKALDSFSEVVDERRRWTPEWYSFIETVHRGVGKVVDLPLNRTDPVTGQPIKLITAGERAFVTDATAVTFSSAVAGGGTNFVPVYFDGSVWRIG